MRQRITNINFTLTTFCSMQCPDCCCNITAMKNAEKRFFNWEYLENAARYFYGMERIHLTGGEPTLHPKFIEWAPLFKELFGCEKLTIETNGFAFKRAPWAFMHFDEIYCSHYTAGSFEGSPDNTEEIEYLRTYLGENSARMIVGEIKHLSRDIRGKNMCSRGWSETVGYSNGKVYPCCVASGIPARDVGIPLTVNWRKEILDVAHPCDICFFATD